MNYARTHQRFLKLEPAPAWIAIGGLILLTAVCVLLSAGKILTLVFPISALAIGLYLYFKAPLLYVGFTWWLWFLAPLVRRLADYRGGGFTDPSPISLAPYLVTFVALITVYRHLPKAYRQGGLPLILALAGIFYAFLIGLISKSKVAAIIGLLDWATPVIFGFHLFIHWRDYPSYRKNLECIFLWAVLVMGAYGIFQYLVAPGWDTFWLVESGMNVQGNPEPREIRVWSTINSGEPFATVMTAGLLLLLIGRSPLNLPAYTVGYLSFLLSQVRSGWLGWLVGLLIMVSSSSKKLQVRLAVTVIVMAICIAPLALIEPFKTVISNRLETFTDLPNDGSAIGRQETYGYLSNLALTSFIGDGIGGAGMDSTVLMMPIHLGWLGTIPYLLGLIFIVYTLFHSSTSRIDPMVDTSQAIVMSCIVRAPLNSITLEASGMIMWAFLGIGMAALMYHKDQQRIIHLVNFSDTSYKETESSAISLSQS
jgi:hypothetical protein